MPKKQIDDMSYEERVAEYDWSKMDHNSQEMKDAAADIHTMGYGDKFCGYLMRNKYMQAVQIVYAMYDEFENNL